MASIPAIGSEETFIDPARNGQRIPFPSLFGEPSVFLSVIVPAYNEQERLATMMDETLAFLQHSTWTYEVIVVDDGSKDTTAEVAMGYTRSHGADAVRVLRLQQNSGKGAAVKKGMLRSRGEYMLLADADAATRFSDVQKLLAAAELIEDRGNAIAIGSRYQMQSKTERSLARKLVSKSFNFYVEWVGGVSGIRDTQCGFKLFTRPAARISFAAQHLDRWAFDVENLYLAQLAGVPIVEVPVHWSEVPGSKLSIVKATINMARDLAYMRYMYVSGGWASGQALPSIEYKGE